MERQTNRKSLSHLMKDEALHAKLCAVALATPTQGHDVVDIKLFLCPECAHLESDRPPASCPICGTQAEEFIPAQGWGFSSTGTSRMLKNTLSLRLLKKVQMQGGA